MTMPRTYPGRGRAVRAASCPGSHRAAQGPDNRDAFLRYRVGDRLLYEILDADHLVLVAGIVALKDLEGLDPSRPWLMLADGQDHPATETRWCAK